VEALIPAIADLHQTQNSIVVSTSTSIVAPLYYTFDQVIFSESAHNKCITRTTLLMNRKQIQNNISTSSPCDDNYE
jgi:hypothetical protein